MRQRTRHIITCATLASFGISLATGLMVETAASEGTPEQRMACQNDAFRLCGQFIPDVENIKACMVKNMRSLSPDCRAQFAKGPKGVITAAPANNAE